jgi:hypothetical protein
VLNLNGAMAVDRPMRDYFDDLYLGGYSAGDGVTTLAAWRDQGRQYHRLGNLRLPLARRALGGWHRSTVSGSRGPLPFVILAGMAMAAYFWGEREAVARLPLSFVAYLRPSEAASPSASDVPEPMCAGNAALRQVVVLPAPWECERPTKVGPYDDIVAVDVLEPELGFLPGALLRLKHARAHPRGPFFEQPYPDFLHVFRECAAAVGGPPDASTYQLRHAAALHDLLFRRLPRAEIQARGRGGAWVTGASLRRYPKQGRIHMVLQNLNQAGLYYCEAAQQKLLLVGQGRPAALAPPFGPPTHAQRQRGFNTIAHYVAYVAAGNCNGPQNRQALHHQVAGGPRVCTGRASPALPVPWLGA